MQHWTERLTVRQLAAMTVALWVLLVFLLWAMPAAAQEKAPPAAPAKTEAPPTVSELDALTLDKLLLGDENLQLKIAQMQEALRVLREQIQAKAKSMDRPGYTLTRDPQTGAWVYAKAEPTK